MVFVMGGSCTITMADLSALILLAFRLGSCLSFSKPALCLSTVIRLLVSAFKIVTFLYNFLTAFAKTVNERKNSINRSLASIQDNTTLADERCTSFEERIASLTRQLITEGQVKRDLAEQLEDAKVYAQNLDTERANLESQVEALISKQNVMEAELRKARGTIAELIESGYKEIVSEGYGESQKFGDKKTG